MASRGCGLVIIIALTIQWTKGFDTEDCVFLTVSSLWQPKVHERPLVYRELELNWVLNPVCDSPQRVGLFSENPRSAQDFGGITLFWVETADFPDGYIKTNISLGYPTLPGGWDDPLDKKDAVVGVKGDHCYPYWVASYNDTTLINVACLKIRPTWMADHRNELSRMPLTQLLIPGTHNSACYVHDNKTSLGRDAFSRFLLTQDADVWSQLVHGIRYLDLRVGYYVNKNSSSSADRFWVNHAMMRVAPLVPVLRQVVRFVTSSPDELVIVDFHRFPIGLDGRRKRHRQLITLLRKELGALALTPNQANNVYTMEDVWNQKKRLIVSYGEKESAMESAWLWLPLAQQWGSQQTTSGLRSYIDSVMEKPRRDPNALWAIMAELTPTPFNVLFDISGSLRQMADDVNRNLTQWIRDVWWQRANIIASDYFLGNNVIDVSVRTNLRKAMMDKRDRI